MSKRQVIIIGSLWSMIFLFLGFPFWLDKLIAVGTGAIIIGLVYSLRIDTTPRKQKTPSQTPYVEHKSHPDVSTPVTTDRVS